MPRIPHYSADQIHEELQSLSRAPFRRELAKILACAPTEAAYREQAERHPDRWGQNAAMFSRMAGYHEKLEVEGSLSVSVQGMSDSQLSERLAVLEAQLASMHLQSTDECSQPVDKPSVEEEIP
jgi:hypothetical protein